MENDKKRKQTSESKFNETEANKMCRYKKSNLKITIVWFNCSLTEIEKMKKANTGV